ncbi:zinc finger protein 185 isoform X2 [Neoarius graeffei]|uniref:zinc finger protein 185 isoform X2 n=1 Tax=Neoarius graeffei TaxID=443677 RepID=UPI00298D38FA|nr:zinc finger protein 185 isoform X2 [Neoarius graeffei]
MTTEGDRQSVLRTTKVRTALKGDSSWIQRYNQSGPEAEEEQKPWIAEVRASRLNSDVSDPVADNTPTEQQPQTSSNTDSSKTSGYIISGTSGFTKKTSEGYKKIAPHTVRSSTERTKPSEPSLSTEEMEKRTEAASKTLNTSARKQRSYVLSAAKKYESTSGNTDSSASPATAFVAKRVVITEEEDGDSAPKQSVEMSVDEPIPPEVSSAKPELKPRVKPEPAPKQSDTLTALSDTLLTTPESTSVSNDETITQATSVAPVAALKKSEKTEPEPDSTPTASTTEPVAPAVPAVKEVPSTTPEPEPEATSNLSINSKPVEKTSVLNDDALLDLTESTPQNLLDPVPIHTDLLAGGSLPKTEKTTGSLDLLAVDIIPIDTNTDKLSTDKTNTITEITQTVVQTEKDVKSTPQSLEDPFPTTTDLLKGGSLPETEKTTESLDLLADDIIPIDTNKDRLSTDKTRSKVETTTTVIQTNSADSFDPIPKVRESTKSSVELFDPLLSDSNNDEQDKLTVTFEQKSSKTSSPWDKWMVPTFDTETEDSSYTVYTRTEENSIQEPDTEAKKNLVYVKSYVKSSDLPRYSSSSDYDYVTSDSSSYAYSSPSSTEGMTTCTYCGGLVGNDSKITIDHLNISCHPECFKCGICSKPMGDFIDCMFLHRGTVHCESCYSNVI